MKNIYKLLFTFLLIGSIVSCDNELDTTPFDRVDAGSGIKTASDVEATLLGAYARLRDGDYYGGEYLAKPDILSDNVTLNIQGRQSNKTNFEWRYTPNGAWGVFTRCYRVIYSANLVVLTSEKAGDLGANFKAEALGLRALAHFDALKVHSKFLTNPNGASSLGLPYITTPDALVEPSRETVQTNYDNIVADLKLAVADIDTDNGEGRLNKAAIYGLLSRAYLYMGQWQLAADAADDAIAASNTAVASKVSFPDVWKDDSSAGVLFLVRNTSLDGISVGTPYSQTGPTGTKSEYVVDFDFFNLFGDNDVRKDAYIFTEEFEGDDYNHVYKYLGRSSGDANVVDMKVIRMAEVYLNKAEALAELASQDAAALTALDEVRANRYTSFVSGNETGNALKDVIKAERRLELAFEGHRFFDLKRWNKSINRSTINGEYSDGTGTPANFTEMTANNYKFELPIPQSEINANTNIEQNPGY